MSNMPCCQAYATHTCGDWRKYAFFNEHHYVRNLVMGNDDFELIVSGLPLKLHVYTC